MTNEEKKKIKQFDRVDIKTLRKYFTGEPDELFENGYIGFHQEISDDIAEEVIDLTDYLDGFLHEKFKEANMDYHFNSEKGCFALSSIFCLANETWNIVQGTFDFEYRKEPFYHSWLEKDGIVYDPAMKVVTRKEMYEEFFIPKYKYNQEGLKVLFKRTGVFTYYEEDLKYGVGNPLFQMVYYDTPRALNDATNTLNELDNFLNQKRR